MKNNKLIFLKKFFLVLSVLGLSSSITNAAPVITISAPAKRPEGIKINGLVGNFTFALGKFINRIVEINKALISKNTPPRGCNRFIFYGAPGNGKRSVVQTVARQNEFELIDISGGYLNTISIEDAKNSLEQALTTAQSIAERDNKVIIMIDDMDLIAQNKNLKATFWQKLD